MLEAEYLGKNLANFGSCLGVMVRHSGAVCWIKCGVLYVDLSRMVEKN